MVKLLRRNLSFVLPNTVGDCMDYIQLLCHLSELTHIAACCSPDSPFMAALRDNNL